MESVLLNDVTLRDGLQTEKSHISLDKKLKLFELIQNAKYNRIEITSFVNPKWVPQFQDAEAFCQALFQKKVDIETMAFVPNAKGLERFIPYPIPWVAAFIAATETFNQKNVNSTREESLKILKELVTKAHAEKRKVRVYISTVFGCPYDGEPPEKEVVELFKKVADLGADEICPSDTIGVAVPRQVENILGAFLKFFPKEKIALHFHNTYGLALSSIGKGFELGIRQFDGSSGGVGGCPFALGATGNVALEDVAYFFYRQGAYSKLTRKPIEDIIRFLDQELHFEIRSSLGSLAKKGAKIYGL